MTARSAADFARVNHKTAAYFFHRLRQIIARRLQDSLPVEGLVEVDESYFGGVRKGKRGRGAAGKVPVFGILKRGGKVHTMMIPDVRKDTLLPIIRQRIVPDSIVYTDSYAAYDILDVSEFHHHKIDHSDAYVLDRHNHIDKCRTSGTRPSAPSADESPLSPSSSKETEFRFNYGTPSQQSRTLKRWAKARAANPIWDRPENYSLQRRERPLLCAKETAGCRRRRSLELPTFWDQDARPLWRSRENNP